MSPVEVLFGHNTIIMKDDAFFLELRRKQGVEMECNAHRESHAINKNQNPWLFFENKGSSKKTLIVLNIIDATDDLVDCICSIRTVGRQINGNVVRTKNLCFDSLCNKGSGCSRTSTPTC